MPITTGTTTTQPATETGTDKNSLTQSLAERLKKQKSGTGSVPVVKSQTQAVSNPQAGQVADTLKTVLPKPSPFKTSAGVDLWNVAPGARLEGVKPGLTESLKWGAFNSGTPIEAFSGKKPRATGTTNHPRGNAIDFNVLDKNTGLPTGSNYQDPNTFRDYEAVAQATRQAMMTQAPELVDKFRFGGYFAGGTNPADQMHVDVSGGPMGAGSWSGGLKAGNFASPKVRNKMSRAESVGMGPFANAPDPSFGTRLAALDTPTKYVGGDTAFAALDAGAPATLPVQQTFGLPSDFSPPSNFSGMGGFLAPPKPPMNFAGSGSYTAPGLEPPPTTFAGRGSPMPMPKAPPMNFAGGGSPNYMRPGPGQSAPPMNFAGSGSPAPQDTLYTAELGPAVKGWGGRTRIKNAVEKIPAFKNGVKVAEMFSNLMQKAGFTPGTAGQTPVTRDKSSEPWWQQVQQQQQNSSAPKHDGQHKPNPGSEAEKHKHKGWQWQQRKRLYGPTGNPNAWYQQQLAQLQADMAALGVTI